MHFIALISLCLVGFATSELTDADMVKIKDIMIKAFDVKGEDLHKCKTDADCVGKTSTQIGDLTKCCTATNVCYTKDLPDIPLVDKDCANDAECRPSYKCKDSKCHWTGPRACEKTEDCPQGLTKGSYECKGFPKIAPGTHCYQKCSVDKDCFECDGETCRYPKEWQAKKACCQGFCQKKIACS